MSLTLPATAAGVPIYVVNDTTGAIDRYDTVPGGALTKGPSVSTTLGSAPTYSRLGAFSTGNGLLVGATGPSGYAAFTLSGGTPVSAGATTTGALSLAAHPELPVVYYLDASTGFLTWRRRQANGTASNGAPGQGGDRNNLSGFTDYIDVVVTDGTGGRSVIGAGDNFLYQFALNADGSIMDPFPPGIDDVSAFGDVISMATNPGGSRLYVLSKSSATDFAVFDYPLNTDGSLGTPTPSNFETTTPTDPLRKLAVSPDGADLYATSASGDIAHWSLAPDQSIAGTGDVQASSAPASDGIGFNPGGGALYTTSPTGGVNQYERDFDTGALTPMTPFQVAGSAGTTPGDLVPGVLPVPFPVLSVIPARAGLPTSFDGSDSFDPDGTVNQFNWSFGDGTTAVNAGPTPTHTYTAGGVYTVTMTTIDTTGTPTTSVFSGHSAAFSGGPSSSTSRQVSIPAAPSPPAAAQTPRPVARRTVIVEEVRGTVLVKLPGSNRFVPLSDVRSIPTGSQIDARKGRVRLTSAADSKGKTQTAIFYEGIFKVTYKTDKGLITELALVGKVGPCPKTKKARATAKRRKRRLWGNGKGRFRTRGKRSSALVRGTVWLVEDRCDGTLTRVTQGSVTVRDFARRKNIVVKRGKRYLARARKR